MGQWNDYWGKYGKGSIFSRFSLNSKTVIIALITLSLLAISVLGIRTGGYIRTLEQNKTNLENELFLCNEQYSNTTTALNVCNKNLNSKTSAYTNCQSQLSTTTDSLSSCQNELNMCQADFDDLSFSITDLSVQLSRCQADLSAASSSQSNYDAMKINYAKDYCCIKNNVSSGQTTYYKLENNKITCFTNSTSGTTAITC